MAIPPIGAYSFRPMMTRPISRTKKASKSKAAKRAEKLAKDADSILFEDGDLDSSTRWFSEKDPAHAAGEGFDKDLLLAHLQAAEELVQSRKFNQAIKRWMPKVYQSYQNMTLPEALIYHALLDVTMTGPLTATLVVDQKPVFVDRLEFTLTIKRQTTILKKWQLCFIIPQKKVLIQEAGKEIGWARYIIRGQKIEEIEGMLLGTPLLLDPIWKTTTKLDLREERIHLAGKRWTLIYNQNQKFSVKTNKTQLSISHDTSNKDAIRCLTCKKIIFNNRAIRSQLLYMRYLLIPFFAEWTIQA